MRRWVPEGLRGARLDPGRPGAIALALVTAVAALAAAIGVWGERPRAEALPAAPAAGLSPLVATTAPTEGPDAGPIVVSVVGKVARPGLVRVPAGARLADALEAAGAPCPGPMSRCSTSPGGSPTASSSSSVPPPPRPTHPRPGVLPPGPTAARAVFRAPARGSTSTARPWPSSTSCPASGR
ncbi:SLBB domain-containing protein [Pseudonocardia benzenivorans]